MNKLRFMIAAAITAAAAMNALASRQGPWTKEKAWQWYNAQPWIRGCNYMPASAANRVDQWQSLGSEERFKEVEKELALAEEIGFNTLRLVIEHQGFGVWLAEHDSFMANFERYLQILDGTVCVRLSFWAMIVRVQRNYGNCPSPESSSMISAIMADAALLSMVAILMP